MPCVRFHVLAGLASLAALFAWAPSSFAASPDVLFTVAPQPSNVSWSRTSPLPQQTYSALEVVVRNDSTNTINDVRFELCARVTDDATPVGPTLAQCAARPLEAVLAPLHQAIGIACTTAAAGTAVSCSIGQLRGRGDGVSFVLIFKAPASGPAIRYDAVASYGEGPNDSSGASHIDTQRLTRVVGLGPPIASEVKSYLPIGGGTLFTGTDGIPKGLLAGDDRWTTRVTVPSAAKVEIVEGVDPGNSCSADYTLCVESTLTIPGTFAAPPLDIVLRRHPDTRLAKAQIRNAQLFYEPGFIDAAGQWVSSSNGVREEIHPCTAGQPNAEVKRCIAYRIEYTRRNAPTPALEGVWEFGVRAFENGRTYF